MHPASPAPNPFGVYNSPVHASLSTNCLYTLFTDHTFLFFVTMKLSSFTSLLSIPLLVSTALAQDPGSILFPTPNQTIAPGSNFTFTYFGRADYGVSSYAYSVWLLNSDVVNTSVPSVADLFTEGWYFGRFDYANYPGEYLRGGPCGSVHLLMWDLICLQLSLMRHIPPLHSLRCRISRSRWADGGVARLRAMLILRCLCLRSTGMAR